jgi:hypothetical protein
MMKKANNGVKTTLFCSFFKMVLFLLILLNSLNLDWFLSIFFWLSPWSCWFLPSIFGAFCKMVPGPECLQFHPQLSFKFLNSLILPLILVNFNSWMHVPLSTWSLVLKFMILPLINLQTSNFFNFTPVFNWVWTLNSCSFYIKVFGIEFLQFNPWLTNKLWFSCNYVPNFKQLSLKTIIWSSKISIFSITSKLSF